LENKNKSQRITMTTNDIANRLVELCRKGQFAPVQKELFANDAVSIEPHATPAFEKETKGLDAILEKGEKWNSMVEKVNSLSVSEPMVGGNSFAVTLAMDVVMKDRGPIKISELCVYSVKDGKIISEQFFM
jgi:ketosteroid isomerase-like protein